MIKIVSFTHDTALSYAEIGAIRTIAVCRTFLRTTDGYYNTITVENFWDKPYVSIVYRITKSKDGTAYRSWVRGIDTRTYPPAAEPNAAFGINWRLDLPVDRDTLTREDLFMYQSHWKGITRALYLLEHYPRGWKQK